MSNDDTNNGDFWKYEVDTVQRHGATAATKARRHGEVTAPSPSDDSDDSNEDNGKYDDYGIPKGV